MKQLKRILTLILTLALVFGIWAVPASAKTISSAKADNIFFYATNAAGKSVLLKIVPLEELKNISHGQAGGKNYYTSTTDNYPTTQYCESQGFTIPELVSYIKSVSKVQGASAINFSSGDTMRFMATDSYGNYSRSWTYDELYSVKRYYFEGLYDAQIGWNTGWEIAGEDNSKFGVSLEEYNKTYKDSDPYYDDKSAVFAAGVESTVILATESYSGRTTSKTLIASTEPGIASYIEANGGKAVGSLSKVLTDEVSLRLAIPMTEADLMAAHRTSYDNFKWIYNMRLDMSSAPALTSLGTVAEPVPSFSLSGNTLTIAFSCDTSGASIYYGDDGAPQTLYTGPISIDVSGRDLSSNPVTIYATAVMEGYDDAGILTFKYPGMAPGFETVYSGMTGGDLVFTAASGVSGADWTTWTNAMTFVTLKTPSVGGYLTVDKAKYSIDNTAKTISFDKSLFTEAGSYSFIFHAAKFADKAVSVTMKKSAPTLRAPESIVFGLPVTVFFDDANYFSGLSVYVTPEDGSRTLISASYLDRVQTGQVTVKSDYFSAASTAMPAKGTYTLELVNNSYSPASQTVTVTLTGGFSDVPQGAWYYDYVTGLADAGIINGIGGGLFAPDDALTWGQAMKLLLLAMEGGEKAPTTTHWASGYMDTAMTGGLIDKGTNPDANISRLEFCRVAAKLLKMETKLTSSPFTDTDDPAVLALYELEIINGMGDDLFAPDGTLTRAQISKIIWLMMQLEGATK